MSHLAKLRARDPDFLNLRTAARAALVAPLLFVLLKVVLELGPLSTFAFFACFVGIVFANFGGRPGPKALAYIGMIVIGDLLIVIGSLLSDTTVAGAAAMFVVVFTVSFASILGGYAPAFVAPAALAYSLAVLDPLSNSAIDVRVLGWTIGGTTAMIAALVLWPVNQRNKLRQKLAEASAGIATALESIHDQDAADAGYRQAVNAMTDARQKMAAPLRPVGPLSRDIGLIHLVEHLEQALDMTRRVLDDGWNPQDDAQLTTACANSFRRSRTLLMEEIDPGVVAQDIPRLDNILLASGRAADVAAIREAEPDSHGKEEASEALAGVRRAFPIMALSHIARWVEATAAIALGASGVVTATNTSPELTPVSDQPAELLHRVRRIYSRELDPDSVVFHNCIRAAAAMSLAVVVARLVGIEHGFWITLAALLVIHSSAASTSATALQAIAGALVGFVFGAIILSIFGNNITALWVLLFCCVFFAGYTPGVVNFVVGQISFTGMVVVLFTLIDPAGITTDLVRVETVALGAACGAVMAFILWPRGARVALAGAVADVYRAASLGMRTVVTESGERRVEANIDMHGARRHTDLAFAIAISERGRQIDTRKWITLFRAPNMVHSLVAGLWRPPSPWLVDHCGAAIAATIDHRNRVADSLDFVADRLDPTGASPAREPPAGHPDDLSPVLMDCINLARPFGPDEVDSARHLVAWNEWLSFVDDYVAAAEPELNYIAGVSRPGAWLHWSLPK